MGIGDLIARGVKASQKASPAVAPQRLAELAEKVRQSGRLPPESKRIMFTRMTQVPAVLAPLGVGAASSQQGLLDGLRENR